MLLPWNNYYCRCDYHIPYSLPLGEHIIQTLSPRFFNGDDNQAVSGWVLCWQCAVLCALPGTLHAHHVFVACGPAERAQGHLFTSRPSCLSEIPEGGREYRALIQTHKSTHRHHRVSVTAAIKDKSTAHTLCQAESPLSFVTKERTFTCCPGFPWKPIYCGTHLLPTSLKNTSAC